MDNAKHIDAEEVHKIIMDCLFRDEELVNGKPTTEPVVVDGITQKFGLHAGRVQSHAARIGQILRALPVEFQQDGGGGMSFLNACMDANGDQWGGHQNMDELFVLGMATGQVSALMPRDMWSVLPGGMPYYMVKSLEPVASIA